MVIGGISNDLISLAYYLKDEFSITVLYGEKEKDEKESLFLLEHYTGLSLRKIPQLKKNINPLRDIKAYITICKEIKNMQCDIVHTHGSKAGLLGRLAAHRAGVHSVVHTFHGHIFHSYYNTFFSNCLVRFERWLTKFTDKVIVVSKQQALELVEKYKIVPEEKISIIYLGVDEKVFFRNNKNAFYPFRNNYDLKTDTIAIGIIGRIVGVKNFDLFTEIVARVLSRNNYNVKFFVVGDGKLKTGVQRKLGLHGINWSDSEIYNPEASVIFTSWVQDVAPVITGLDIIILTSLNEGTPMSLIEAQLSGKPVVATDVGGVRDTFIDNETGFLIASGNAEDFANKLELLIKNSSLRESMGLKASVFASNRFSKKSEVEKLRQLYSQII